MHPDLLELLRSLQSRKVEFLVVGSMALAVHARPRFTEDLDIWVRRTEDNTQRLANALKDFGLPIQDGALDSFWEKDRQMITLGAKPQAVDLLNFLAEDDFAVAWSGRSEATIADVTFPVIGLREFVRAKRVAGRPKDLADLALLEEVLGNLPD